MDRNEIEYHFYRGKKEGKDDALIQMREAISALRYYATATGTYRVPILRPFHLSDDIDKQPMYAEFTERQLDALETLFCGMTK